MRLLDESARRPAVIVGTSSDRIGTPTGQSFYVTASKDLERETGLPIAPYLGAAYGTYARGRYGATLVLVRARHPGASFNVRF